MERSVCVEVADDTSASIASWSRGAVRPPVTAEHVPGQTGLPGLHLPEPEAPARAEHGVDHIVAALRAAGPGEITLCLLGPATDLALALVKAPDIAARVAEVVWVAGARHLLRMCNYRR